MKNQFRNLTIIAFLASIFLLSSTAQAQSQPNITDPANDVTEVRTTEGANGQMVINYKIVSDEPNIDILSASYVNNGNNTASITLNVKGKIEFDNSTYYEIQLNEQNNTIRYELIYSNISNVAGILDQTPNTKYSIIDVNNSTINGFGTMNSYVNNSSVMMTINGNNLTSSENTLFNIVLPQTFLENSTSSWHIITWHASSASLYNSYGNQYFDYYPNSDNKYTSLYGPIQSSPGFELITIVAIPILILLKKKGKF